MDGVPPPTPAAAQAPECASTASAQDAARVLANIARSLPGTRFVAAWPSCVPGLFALKLADGSVAYTDKSARYLVLGLLFDTATGKALDRQMDALKE